MEPLEGNIEMWEGMFTGWQQGYYVLVNDLFMLFTSKGGKLKGQAHLGISTLTLDKNDHRRMEIDTGFCTIKLRTSTNDQAIRLRMGFLNAKKIIKKDKEEPQVLDPKSEKNAYREMQEKDMEQLNELIAEMWITHSLFEEELSLLEGRVRKLKEADSKTYESLTMTLKLAFQLKRDSTNCYKKIEEVGKRIYGVAALILEKKSTMIKQNSLRTSMVHNQLLSPTSTSDKLVSLIPNRQSRRMTGVGELDEGRSLMEVASFLDDANNSDNTPFESFEGLDGVMYQDEEAPKPELKRLRSQQRQSEMNGEKPWNAEKASNSVALSPISQIQRGKEQNALEKKNWQNLDFLLTNPIYQALEIKDEKLRKELPVAKHQYEKINPWLVVKELKGKEFDDFEVPVYLKEPLSTLQRICEQFEYSSLLDEADGFEDSYKRLSYVMAFAISTRSHLHNRTRKPFTSLVGETFEFESTEKKWRFLAEHISNDPQTSVYVCYSDSFECWGTVKYKMNFRGKTLDIMFLDLVHIILKTHGDFITYNNGTISVSSIALGSPKIELNGKMSFESHKAIEHENEKGVVIFGTDRDNLKRVEGLVKNTAGTRDYYRLEGEWNEELTLITKNETKNSSLGKPNPSIWKRSPALPNAELHYNFSEFALQLNHLTKDLVGCLPITDSRFRPDMIALEHGNLKLAEEESKRISKKNQMQFTKQSDNSEIIHSEPELQYSPKWFELRRDNEHNLDYYSYNGKYWKQREKQEFANFESIF